MNKLKYIILATTFLLVGCNDDFLDKFPLDSVTHGTYWKTETN